MLLSLLLSLLLTLAGCGKKGPVRPLRQPLPDAVQRFEVRQLGARFLLAWDLPKINQDGSELTDLEGFRVFKMKFNPADDCPECRDTSVLMQEVDIDYLRKATRIGDRFYLWDTEMETGSGYQYRVAPFNRKGREGQPALVRVLFLPSPPSPINLEAAGKDKLVSLRWQPIDDPRQGAEALGVNLYRRTPDAPFPPTPLNREPLKEGAFDDFAVENGQQYLYAARSVVRLGRRVLESGLSATASAAPQAGR
ncbi:lipoprotein [Desulfuromonas versatilis]|uniref:Lipoprotein n=1 Tax=Desulfuromonas versatilis TaxID=2802975 RepID=A0ABM8HZH6_9BACT|nr:lipoprotein [Desulfuromonas versatilis]